MRWILFCLSFVAAGVLAAAGTARADCPVDSVWAYGWHTSTAPAFAAGGVIPISASASYDLTAGTATSWLNGTNYSIPIVAQTRTTDRYTLSGPGLSPITFHATIFLTYHLTSRQPCGNCVPGLARGGGSLRYAGQVVVDSLAAHSQTTINTVRGFELELEHGPGETFELSMWTFGRVAWTAYAYVQAQLAFTDLPPGYAIDSCQGFHAMGDEPVPVARRTWGRLKVLYR